MTSHDTALEAALWKLHEREHAKLGEMLANKDEANNWQGGKVNGITAALELVRNASTLSPDVSGLVEQLRRMADTEVVEDRINIAREAANALASLSLQLAAVEGEAVHSDDLAVDRFAVAMKTKLARKRAEGVGGWDDPEQCHIDYLVSLLMQQVHERAVLDPIDIANISMMIYGRGEKPSHGR